MTKETKIIIILSAVLLIVVNVLVWQIIPTKNDPLLELKKEQLEDTLKEVKEENEILYKGIETYETKIDSLNQEITKTKQDAWRTKKKINDLRTRKPDNSMLDSLLLARRKS